MNSKKLEMIYSKDFMIKSIIMEDKTQRVVDKYNLYLSENDNKLISIKTLLLKHLPKK